MGSNQTPTPAPLTSSRADLGLLIARLALGGVMLAHGLQKVLVYGVAGTQQAFAGMGAPLPEFSALAVIALEVLGGIALIAGLLTPLVATLNVLSMLGAAVLVHLPNGFFAATGGWELVGLLAAISLAVAIAGSGRYGIDGVLRARRAARSDIAEPVGAGV